MLKEIRILMKNKITISTQEPNHYYTKFSQFVNLFYVLYDSPEEGLGRRLSALNTNYPS